jgi:alkanesulfonate monooxygenase SsuD/methylene tetrahydromethanopterin reductase-like flavin-dependent oxidoreductase (luciferase family)
LQIGVGLPATIPHTPGQLVTEWARCADDSPFSSLAAFDRILYDNYECLTTLAAAAAVTRRIMLAASVVIGPLRSAALLAKQAATVNALSGGRLVLGLGLGARRDDYDVTGSDYRSRGRFLTDQLARMREWWEGDEIGPHPPGRSAPKILVGGLGGVAMSRMARHADGYIHNGGPPRAFARLAAEARAAWEDAGRPGRPELWGMAYYALGDDTREAGAAYLKDYYAFTGAFAERIAAGLLTTADEICEFLEGYEEAGCDELILFPTVPSIDELHRLGGVVARV